MTLQEAGVAALAHPGPKLGSQKAQLVSKPVLKVTAPLRQISKRRAGL